MHSRRPILAAVGVAVTLMASAANATVTININQVGANVVATGSGSLDLTGLSLTSFLQRPPLFQMIYGAGGYVGLGDSNASMYSYLGLTGPTSFGSGAVFFSSSSSGSSFDIGSYYFGVPAVAVPAGYVSGTAISDTATWLGQSFASLGLIPGTYTWYLPNGSPDVIVNIGPVRGAVPEPATWAMMLLGFLGVGFALSRRRKNAPAPLQLA